MALFFCVLTVSACSTDGESKTSIDPATARTNCELYAANCFDCHGAEARGDGPHGMHLDPAPTDLRSPDSRALGREMLFALVRDGISGTGMPAFSDLLSEDEIRATLDHVDSLAAGTAATCQDGSGSDSEAAGVSSTGGAGGSATGTTGEPDLGTTGAATTDSQTSDSDSEESTGPGGTTGTSVSPECEAWCSCLEAACSDVAGYPIGSVEECHVECAMRTDEEIACWQGFCDSVAESPALADHNCEHAWGGLGLAEC